MFDTAPLLPYLVPLAWLTVTVVLAAEFQFTDIRRPGCLVAGAAILSIITLIDPGLSLLAQLVIYVAVSAVLYLNRPVLALVGRPLRRVRLRRAGNAPS